MQCGSVAGRDRVLAIRCDRNRGRVLIADENTPLCGGRSSRRAGTRALPEKHPRSGLEMLMVGCPGLGMAGGDNEDLSIAYK